MFPNVRMRRYRCSAEMRGLSQETRLVREDLVLPLFIAPGKKRKEAVPSMEGVFRMSVDVLKRSIKSVRCPAVLIFGVPDAEEKDLWGTPAVAETGLVPSAIQVIKAERPDLVVITDVCLCGSMSHGHCGVVNDSGEVKNDETLEILARMAAVHAASGADIVAPSGMMDGQVQAIRDALESGGFANTAIMAYAAKFASCFYGPSRDAAHSSPSFGDRRAYQLSPANRREAMRDALLDEAEGADWLMVKPAMPYLDILAELRSATLLPLSAYQVSGEYAMLKAGAKAGAFEERQAVLESLTCIKRAGADLIITYYADEICDWL